MNEDIAPLLQREAEACGLTLSAEQCAAFSQYRALVLDWNEKVNLTAITEPEAFVCRHFLDSLWPMRWLSLAGKACIDVGTGAGFPGLALKLACEEMQLTLLDSLQKRLRVLDAMCGALGVQAHLVHARAEEGGHAEALRESFDYAFARAVAPLRVLCEYCLPFVRVGGSFCAWKGPQMEEEWTQAKRALSLLGGELVRREEYALPDGSGRTFLEFRKVRPTPQKYPRPSAKLKKAPL